MRHGFILRLRLPFSDWNMGSKMLASKDRHFRPHIQPENGNTGKYSRWTNTIVFPCKFMFSHQIHFIGSLKLCLKFLVQPHHESRSSDTGTQNLINNTRTQYQKAVPTRQEANIIFHSVNITNSYTNPITKTKPNPNHNSKTIESQMFSMNKSQHHYQCQVSELHCTSVTILAIGLR